MAEMIPWHRLFGILWTDLLTDQPATVEMEKDLSLQQQFLDVVIVRKMAEPIQIPLPDGFEDLAGHNLLTFKSHQETLTAWAVLELISHFVNYRKLVSARPSDLLPSDDFRLFAVTVRYPRDLAAAIPLTEVRPGVYDVTVVSQLIRVIVVERLPQADRNAVLLLLSLQRDNVQFAAHHYRQQSDQTTTLLRLLFERYQLEGINMPYTVADFERDAVRILLQEPAFARLVLDSVPVEQRLEGVPVEQRLEGVPMDELLRTLTAEQRAELVERIQAAQGGTPADE